MRLSFVTDKKEQRAKISKPVIIQSYFGCAITFPKFQSLHVYSIALCFLGFPKTEIMKIHAKNDVPHLLTIAIHSKTEKLGKRNYF